MFTQKQAAIDEAKRVWPLDFFGVVKLTPCHLERKRDRLRTEVVVCDGESEHFDGKDWN